MLRLLSVLICLSLVARAQEMDSDLYAALNSSTLSGFMKTAYTTMTVVTYRASKQQGLVEEHTATYRKGKINTDRINFTINYTEYFLLEDRKKSIGRYDFNAYFDVIRYERTDFNTRNIRTFTFYHYYTYEQHILKREFIRLKEYIGTGSVEMDTVVTTDSVVYKLDVQSENLISQQDLSEGGATIIHTLEAGKLISKKVQLTGFAEEDVYGYDARGQLVSIETSLVGEDGQRISNLTKIHYSTEGLPVEIIFQDQQGIVLEKKVITYK